MRAVESSALPTAEACRVLLPVDQAIPTYRTDGLTLDVAHCEPTQPAASGCVRFFELRFR